MMEILLAPMSIKGSKKTKHGSIDRTPSRPEKSLNLKPILSMNHLMSILVCPTKLRQESPSPSLDQFKNSACGRILNTICIGLKVIFGYQESLSQLIVATSNISMCSSNKVKSATGKEVLIGLQIWKCTKRNLSKRIKQKIKFTGTFL